MNSSNVTENISVYLITAHHDCWPICALEILTYLLIYFTCVPNTPTICCYVYNNMGALQSWNAACPR